ncbi:hypothetical protein RHGRI_035288 [Rhododendron griersonianum]|uniref:Uncharacterized protein n=1 Tax=Rhododendron griersonianum TaxID=479676 RepID=A0AAV6I8M0_9ERIC|nr:hypothetical protein RHGRI_035288 [Rhododendron griersonianum]
MMDVDHVLDTEEVFQLYSRLKSPVYPDIVNEFFMDMCSEFFLPQPSTSITNSSRRLGPLKFSRGTGGHREAEGWQGLVSGQGESVSGQGERVSGQGRQVGRGRGAGGGGLPVHPDLLENFLKRAMGFLFVKDVVDNGMQYESPSTLTLSHLLRQPLRRILCRRPPQSEASGAAAVGAGGGRAVASRDTTRVVGTSLATLILHTIVNYVFHEKKTHSPLQEILEEIRMNRKASTACPPLPLPPLPRNPLPLARNTLPLAQNPTPATPPPPVFRVFQSMFQGDILLSSVSDAGVKSESSLQLEFFPADIVQYLLAINLPHNGVQRMRASIPRSQQFWESWVP